MKRRFLAVLLSLGLLCSSAGAVLSVEDARTLVEELYIDEVPEEVLSADTVEELFAGLDQYSSYFTPEQYQAFWDSMNDVSTVGIGVTSSLSEDGTCLEIVKVFEGSAAEKAGIRAGDSILAIDGRPVAEAGSLEEAGSWMREEEGTKVTLTILSPGGGRWETTVTRAPFVIPYTQYELVDGHIGYITCSSFGDETYGHFVDALEELGEDTDHWILDLRDNGGGLTQAAADVASIFTGSGNKGLLRVKDGTYYGFPTEKEETTIYPVIAMVSGETASAAEMLSATLRDSQAGLIIGSRTFGKGTAQTVVDQTVEPEMFADGDAVRITSGRFYSYMGLANDRIGVIPHLMVEEPYVADVAYLLSYTAQFPAEENILRLHLGAWRWNVSLEQAMSEAYRPAFVALLEALWPETVVYWSTSGGGWEEKTVAETVEACGLTEYTSRTFADAAESDHQFALNVLGTYGILRGDGTGNVDPDGELTRGQLCAMLAQALDVAYVGPSQFDDVAGKDWYFSSVNAMAKLGFVEGDGTGAFHPDDVLTNEQMIAILARFAAWLDVSFYEDAKEGPEEGELEDEILVPYSDWARDEVWLLGMCRKNLFGDYISYVWEDIAEIAPQETALRETTAQSLYRLMALTGALVP